MPLLLGRVCALPFLAVGLSLLQFAPPASAQTGSSFAVTLLWTTTGDNGLSGQAAKYDLRYSANAVPGSDTLAWWNTAAVIYMANKVPPPSGSRDSVVIGGLAARKYFAILRIADAAGNWSGFSNLATIDLTKNVTAVDSGAAGAPKLVVGAPYPSPTRGVAEVALTLARSGPLSADVFDAFGRRVRSLHGGSMEAGPHTLRWDGSAESGQRAAAGVYWIRVAAAGVHRSVKLIVLR